jgi:hypothetical protein
MPMFGKVAGATRPMPSALPKRFLGGKALGEKARRIAHAGKLGALLRRQDAAQRTLAMALVQAAEAGDGDDVGADTDDHRSDRACASRSRRFISRTASRRPTKTARLMIAWPMCSSRMPQSCATGCTLK